jgi:exonuclease VII small subunit
MPITDEVRKYGETVLEQGKVALDEARKPWSAAVGAGELAYGQLQAQLAQLPAEVQARVRTLQANGRQLDPAMLREAVESARAEGLRFTTQARETYESLAHRGELVVRRLRRSPQVSATFRTAEELVAEAGETVAAAEEKVTEPGRPTTRKPAGTKAAKTAPATARKAPAKRSPKTS